MQVLIKKPDHLSRKSWRGLMCPLFENTVGGDGWSPFFMNRWPCFLVNFLHHSWCSGQISSLQKLQHRKFTVTSVTNSHQFINLARDHRKHCNSCNGCNKLQHSPPCSSIQQYCWGFST